VAAGTVPVAGADLSLFKAAALEGFSLRGGLADEGATAAAAAAGGIGGSGIPTVGAGRTMVSGAGAVITVRWRRRDTER
jgi:hypothetical protein